MEIVIVFAFPDYEHVLDSLPPATEKGGFEVSRFANGELFASVRTPVRVAHCIVLGLVAPLDEKLLSLTLLAHTLKKEGCQSITAFIPYLGYSRGDKGKTGESLATAWIGSLLMASGVDQVLTVDAHSERDKQLFSIPLVSISPVDILAGAIKKFEITDATIIAPDNGAIPRCEAVNHALGRQEAEIPYLEKKRDKTGIKHAELRGRPGLRTLIIDDILDTGATLISACEKLLQAGSTEIYIMVTHGLFTGADWRSLWSLKVQRIFCTDTIPPTKDILGERRITILPIGQLVKDQIAHLARTATD